MHLLMAKIPDFVDNAVASAASVSCCVSVLYVLYNPIRNEKLCFSAEVVILTFINVLQLPLSTEIVDFDITVEAIVLMLISPRMAVVVFAVVHCPTYVLPAAMCSS
jgi:hypothetical protein